MDSVFWMGGAICFLIGYSIEESSPNKGKGISSWGYTFHGGGRYFAIGAVLIVFSVLVPH